jgi:dihydrofolate reductase
MQITLIAAFDKNQAIGIQGDLPWHLSSDLQNFKKITTGNTIVMGRKTYDSIGRALPHRKNIVLTRNTTWKKADVITINNVNEIYEVCPNEKEIYIIGGAEIYNEFIDIATKMILSYVDVEINNADAFFPTFELSTWPIINKSKQIKEENDDYFYRIIEHRRLT